MLPRVVQVVGTRSYDLIVQFDDGKLLRWNAQPLVQRGGVFARLADPDVFCEELTVLNGTVAWSSDFNPYTCVDLDPLVLYHDGEAIRPESTSITPTES